MPDTLKPASKQWHLRQRRHRHNSYQGHVTMCMSNMVAVMNSDSTTPEAKAIAMKVYTLAKALKELLRKRVD